MGAVVADEPLEGPRLSHGRVLLLQVLQNLDEGGEETGCQKMTDVHLRKR